jgi:hypothetical protein
LLHTKNPDRALIFKDMVSKNHTLCVTAESDIDHGLSEAPPALKRLEALRKWPRQKMVTIEPVLRFAPARFADAVLACNPAQVNIGADSGNNNLPEPSQEELKWFIGLISGRTHIHYKENLRRIYTGGIYGK